MKMQRKLLFFALVFLLLSAGIVIAQSPTNYNLQRFVALSGGLSSSANYTVNSVIGQPAAGVVDSLSYKTTAGFLYPLQQEGDFEIWLPVMLK